MDWVHVCAAGGFLTDKYSLKILKKHGASVRKIILKIELRKIFCIKLMCLTDNLSN